jgi:hypothetical protein
MKLKKLLEFGKKHQKLRRPGKGEKHSDEAVLLRPKEQDSNES